MVQRRAPWAKKLIRVPIGSGSRGIANTKIERYGEELLVQQPTGPEAVRTDINDDSFLWRGCSKAFSHRLFSCRTRRSWNSECA